MLIAIVEKEREREKRVSNSTIPACKSSFFKYKVHLHMFSIPRFVKVLSQLLHKSMSGDLCTSKTAFRQLDTLYFSRLCTLAYRIFSTS